MFSVQITYADGHVLTRFVYAYDAQHAVKIGLRGRFVSSGSKAYSHPSNIVDARAYDQCVQIHLVASKVMAHVDAQRLLQENAR
jgi:hypothetical protein